jgi:hypothetical protein
VWWFSACSLLALGGFIIELTRETWTRQSELDWLYHFHANTLFTPLLLITSAILALRVRDVITAQMEDFPAISAAEIAQHTYRLQLQALLPLIVLLALDNLRQGLFLYSDYLTPAHEFAAVSGIGWGVNSSLNSLGYLLFSVALASPAIAMPAYALGLWLSSRLVLYGILLILEIESYLVVKTRAMASLDLLSFTFYDLSKSVAIKWLGLLLFPLLIYWLSQKRCYGLRSVCLIVPVLLLVASLHPLLEREHRPLPALGITAAAVEGMQHPVLGSRPGPTPIARSAARRRPM